MPTNKNQSEAKLEKLAQQLREGWKKMHPVKEEDLKGVREAVRHEWQQRKERTQDKSPKKNPEDKPKSKDRGHSH